MDFEKRKAATLTSLASSVTDKSPKGTLDTQILPLINTLNSHPSYFTTSSCSGRISILSQPKSNSTNKKKARGGSWIYITHEKADPTQVISLLFSNQSTESTELVFRFEPLIIAIECKTVESAQILVSLAISLGFRESGITSVSKKRVIVGIRCSIRMEVPLGFSDRVLVSEEYVRFIVDLGNEKMEANWKRTQGFLTALKESFGSMGFGNVNGDCGFGYDSADTRDGDVDVLEFSSVVDHEGLEGDSDYSLSVSKLTVVNEPVEKLYLWGHSSCVLDHGKHRNKPLVFGGFGGMGRHARRSDSLVFDPISGMLEVIDCRVMPSPRLGHTASLVGDSVFVIGGRADPLSILSDVWALDVSKNEWRLLKCSGDLIPPRHRHAAAVSGSNIYVFGGLNNDVILSSMHVLSTERLQWKEVVAGGEPPCARHSHAMVAYESQLLLFGGYDGEKALGDLFSFDIQTCMWKKEKTTGRTPCARFSHSIFVYKNFVGVIGGCPISQHFQELALLDLRLRAWKHVTLEYIGKELLVRSTTNVVGDDLIIIGGGAACYAFGTKFSEPLKINLLPLMSTKDQLISPEIKKKHVNHQFECINGENNVEIQCYEGEHRVSEMTFEVENHAKVGLPWVLQFERKYAKLGKDILKKFGWLDLERKVYTQKDGIHICFPVTEKFLVAFNEKKHHNKDAVEDVYMTKQFTGERILLSELSSSTALNLLKECRGILLEDKVVEVRRTGKSPLQTMKEVVASLIETKGLPADLLEQLPTRWERLGDITVIPITSFKDPIWDSMGEELWPAVAKSLNAHRLARQGRVASTGTRDSMLEMLVGDNGWVDHRENGIVYSFDATKCMFSWGNLSEKLRMGNFPCKDEIIVDLFAGIGYFVLPFLVRANAKLVYACEWNPHAIKALKRNLDVNSVSERCIVLEGDNRMTAPKGVANRVCLGLLPTSEGSWVTAVRALRSEGGTLHVHANVKDTEENSWCQYVSKSIDEIAKSEGLCWEASVEHVERVKWYAPHIRHLVADVKCRQIRR